MTTLVTGVTTVVFINKVISITVVAMVSNVTVSFVVTLVTKITNVHVRPHETTLPPIGRKFVKFYIWGLLLKFFQQMSILDTVGQMKNNLHADLRHLWQFWLLSTTLLLRLL